MSPGNLRNASSSPNFQREPLFVFAVAISAAETSAPGSLPIPFAAAPLERPPPPPSSSLKDAFRNSRERPGAVREFVPRHAALPS